ncbi:helix-turn-helix domain-containing protein [Sunxiuqinia dokdonensis]|uniref:HTH cro/C1-type domain-containing protein n=1 Tax=Sunxiuqinia dokdonensis TaxID=1409788 RepID=A0A0L8VF02_9BACT|nr:helix-turn-helix transcriptional regulator [Sunxiuqinia dokdonensis]KOH47055.1 hypothetical protein NC99_00980 [Sunxiuqinia dokdonensis]
MKRIKELRKAKKISQKQMAEALNISQPGYQKIEQGINVLSIERFLEICRILGINSYNDLLPAVSADVVESINNTLIEGNLSFSHILENAKYSAKLVDELVDRIKDSDISKEGIIEELEFLNNYLAIIRKESTQKEYALRHQLIKTDKID